MASQLSADSLEGLFACSLRLDLDCMSIQSLLYEFQVCFINVEVESFSIF